MADRIESDTVVFKNILHDQKRFQENPLGKDIIQLLHCVKNAAEAVLEAQNLLFILTLIFHRTLIYFIQEYIFVAQKSIFFLREADFFRLFVFDIAGYGTGHNVNHKRNPVLYVIEQ